MVSFTFCFGLVVSLGTMPTAGNAEIKVQKYAPCEKLYFKMARYIKKVGATHYAVATTGGRSLKASNTGCGFDSGFDSKSYMQSSALRQCNLAKKRGGYPGKCRVIESR
jgi:hypothetical protein